MTDESDAEVRKLKRLAARCGRTHYDAEKHQASRSKLHGYMTLDTGRLRYWATVAMIDDGWCGATGTGAYWAVAGRVVNEIARWRSSVTGAMNGDTNTRMRRSWWTPRSPPVGILAVVLRNATDELLDRIGQEPAFVVGHRLPGAFWEAADVGFRLDVDRLDDLSVAGPNHSAHFESDTTEPYRWEPGDYPSGAITYTDGNGVAGGLEAWPTDFAAAVASDNTLRATLVMPIPG